MMQHDERALLPQTDWRSSSNSFIPLSRYKKFGSSDLDEVRDYMATVFCPHYLRTSHDARTIDFKHYSADLSDVSLNVIDYGNEKGTVSVTAPQVGEYYLAQFSLAGSAEVDQGNGAFQLNPGAVFVIDPDRPLAEHISSGYVHLTMRVKRSALQKTLSRDLGFMPDEPVVFDPVAAPLRGPASSLMRMVSAVCEDLETTGSGMALSRVSQHIETTLLSLLLNTVPHNYSTLLNQSASAPAPYYMRRVYQYIAAHACEPISLADMVAVSGVSARSLHAGFRHYKETTPMGYLKAFRLDLARRKLCEARAQGLSVTDVALACGFNHLSKFSRDYSLRFGEFPSQTLSGRGA